MSFSLRRQASRTIGSLLESPVTDRLLVPSRPTKLLENTSVHLLIPSRMMRMGALAARSLEAASGHRWQFFFHDDGSLTDKDVEFLQRHFEDARILRRPQIEEDILARLAPWPTLAHFRRRHFHAMKLLDPWFHAPHQKYIVMDVDVLFLRRPEKILLWAQNQDDACYYNEDRDEVYGVSREVVERAFSFPLWPKVNGGLVLLNKTAFSLDLCADFLTRCSADVKKPPFLEQFLFALNLSHHGKGGPLPKEYRVHWGGRIPPETISCHLVGDTKWTSFFVSAMRKFPR